MKTQGDNDLIQKLINQYEESNKKFREMIFMVVTPINRMMYTLIKLFVVLNNYLSTLTTM